MSFTRKGINSTFTHVWVKEGDPIPVRDESREFKVNVWAGIVGDKLVGPHFLPDQQTGQNYANFLKLELKKILAGAGVDDMNQIWYQQVGSAAHNSKVALERLNKMFGKRWIGRLGAVNTGTDWPPNSNDLSPMKFFLWKKMQRQVYRKRNIQDLDQLKKLIVAEFEAIKSRPNDIAELRDNMVERCKQCAKNGGKKFEQDLNSAYTFK